MKDSHKKIKKKIPHLPKTTKIFKKPSHRLIKTSVLSRIEANLYKNSWSLILLLSLLIIFLVLIVYNSSIKRQLGEEQLLPFGSFKAIEYPYAQQTVGINISAESAIIIDDTSKVIIYEKNPQLRFSMASTTKIMTALVGLESFRLDDIIAVNTKYSEGAMVGFPVGEKVFFEDMLYGLLLPSGNDAAFTIAENFPGGVSAFVQKMNEKARSLGLFYTHYVDPAGLDDDGNYTTASDLAHLASYALKNSEFSRITSTKQKTIYNVEGTHRYYLINLNRLLGTDGVIGIKTGFTEGAGEVLVTAKEERGHTFIIVVMRSLDRFGDTQQLLSYISNEITFLNPEKYLYKQIQ